MSNFDNKQLIDEFKTYWRGEKRRIMRWINEDAAYDGEELDIEILKDINYITTWGKGCFNEIKHDALDYFTLGYILGKIKFEYENNVFLIYDFIEVGHLIFNEEAKEETKIAVTTRYS